MKKLLCILLGLCICLSLAACSGGGNKDGGGTTNPTKAPSGGNQQPAEDPMASTLVIGASDDFTNEGKNLVLGIAGLSFLGFGVQPPNAEIGLMIQDGMNYIRSAPWMFIFPGLLLAVYSIMFNTVGDALQD